ncbi:MAG TPA: Bro-N domain-containing protein [Tepidisphaeraceae bacterium]|jgi:hypothetical protein|nr:Bro-N domain-containing protein [Tepidisphaeraceae bacterium]
MPENNNPGPNPDDSLVVFGGKEIRRAWVGNEWFFSVVDIVAALTDSTNPRNYWNTMKSRAKKTSGVELSALCVQLRLKSLDGKSYLTESVNTKNAFRVIQSIPSAKAEPFKQWLAQMGYERVQEIENPELAQHRMRSIYKAKGYPDDWIEKRMRSVVIRDTLTAEWKKRGIREQKDFSILTAEICKATFGLTPSQYKSLKGLKRENLRDHMSDLELIFSMLGEASTTEIARNKNVNGFEQNRNAAAEGGAVAGNARRQLEAKSGKRIVTGQNYLIEKPKPSIDSTSAPGYLPEPRTPED